MKSIMGFILAFIIGIFPAFFINFNAVFSDSSGSIKELLSIYLLIIISYGLIGAAFGFLGKKKPFVWTVTICLPTIIIITLYSFSEPQTIGQSIINTCLTFASTWTGSYLGVRLKPERWK